MVVSQRIRDFVEREFSASDARKVLDLLESLGDDFLDRQDPERMAAAVVVVALRSQDIDDLAERIHGDFRDLLMGAGLASRDWPEVLNAKFGEA